MQFLIVGAGALGSIFAALLARAGTPVALVARGRRAEQIESQGVRLRGLIELDIPVPVIRPDQPGAIDADVVILGVKTYDTEAALSPLRFTGRPVALSLQNGVLKNAELARFFGAEQVLGTAASIAGELLADGTVQYIRNERLPIGELSGPRSRRVEQIVGLLAGAGLAASASDDVASVEWTKYASFVALFSAALLTRQYTWCNLSDPDCSLAAARLVRETAALAAASGVRVDDNGVLPIASIAAASLAQAAQIVRDYGEKMKTRAPTHRVSALQDLLRGGRLEVDAILGHAVRLGAKLGVPVPTITTCHQFCAVLDRQTRIPTIPSGSPPQ